MRRPAPGHVRVLDRVDVERPPVRVLRPPPRALDVAAVERRRVVGLDRAGSRCRRTRPRASSAGSGSPRRRGGGRPTRPRGPRPRGRPAVPCRYGRRSADAPASAAEGRGGGRGSPARHETPVIPFACARSMRAIVPRKALTAGVASDPGTRTSATAVTASTRSSRSRGGGIRTRDLCVPNAALYQTELRPGGSTKRSHSMAACADQLTLRDLLKDRAGEIRVVPRCSPRASSRRPVDDPIASPHGGTPRHSPRKAFRPSAAGTTRRGRVDGAFSSAASCLGTPPVLGVVLPSATLTPGLESTRER